MIKELQIKKITLMKEKDEANKDIISIINSILTAKKNKLVTLSTQKKEKVEELNEKEEISVVESVKKELIQEIEGLKKADRDYSKQKRQLDFVESLLPQKLSEEEMKSMVYEFISRESPSNIGEVMKYFKSSSENVDLKFISNYAKEII